MIICTAPVRTLCHIVCGQVIVQQATAVQRWSLYPANQHWDVWPHNSVWPLSLTLAMCSRWRTALSQPPSPPTQTQMLWSVKTHHLLIMWHTTLPWQQLYYDHMCTQCPKEWALTSIILESRNGPWQRCFSSCHLSLVNCHTMSRALGPPRETENIRVQLSPGRTLS